jgi:hypothetical protein
MSYCPQCLTEYQEGLTECSECAVPLLNGAPQYCPKCEEYFPAEDTFCDHCGVLLPLPEGREVPECENHPPLSAVGGCIICGKPLCEECIHEIEGKFFCTDDLHFNLHQDYVVAYTTSTDYEAEMIKANLDGAGIDAMIFNQHDHVYFLNMGVLAQVNVMVPKSQIEKAQQIIISIFEDQPQSDTEASGEPA